MYLKNKNKNLSGTEKMILNLFYTKVKYSCAYFTSSYLLNQYSSVSYIDLFKAISLNLYVYEITGDDLDTLDVYKYMKYRRNDTSLDFIISNIILDYSLLCI